MTYIRFYDKVYLATYYVGIGKDKKGFLSKIRRYNLELESDPYDDAFFEGLETRKATFCFIYVSSYDRELLAHETLHALCWLYSKRGIPINVTTDEAACFYQQYLLGEIDTRYKKGKKDAHRPRNRK